MSGFRGAFDNLIGRMVSNPEDNDPAERLKIRGHGVFTLLDENKNVKMIVEADNAIMGGGFNAIGECIAYQASRPSVFRYTAIGTDSTAVATSQTALNSQNSIAIATWDGTGKYKWVMTRTFGAGVATGTIQESGMFNSSSGGTMLNRQTFTAIPKGAADSLQVEWTYNLS